jgi:hypothetical protein
VFTNSLDHAFDPLKAVEVWLRQIKEEGLIFIELSPNSGRLGYTGLDIFSIEPEIFPFYLMQNLGGKLIVRSIHFIEKGNNRRVLFEIGHFHAARIT